MKSILIKEFFENSYVATREAITFFFENINSLEDKEILLDFSGINFISRSCADEYIKRKLNSKKILYEINFSSNVSKMFSLAAFQHKRELGIAAQYSS